MCRRQLPVSRCHRRHNLSSQSSTKSSRSHDMRRDTAAAARCRASASSSDGASYTVSVGGRSARADGGGALWSSPLSASTPLICTNLIDNFYTVASCSNAEPPLGRCAFRLRRSHHKVREKMLYNGYPYPEAGRWRHCLHTPRLFACSQNAVNLVSSQTWKTLWLWITFSVHVKQHRIKLSDIFSLPSHELISLIATRKCFAGCLLRDPPERNRYGLVAEYTHLEIRRSASQGHGAD